MSFEAKDTGIESAFNQLLDLGTQKDVKICKFLKAYNKNFSNCYCYCYCR
jgi:hypothetical protein